MGAGVVGLTCAVRLLEDGHRVDVLARDLPLETVSALGPVLDLPSLATRIDELGGTITRMALPALPGHAELVVNASGLGARHLADDQSVEPMRGQVVLVSQVGLDRLIVDGPTYVAPREHDIVVGATFERGAWSLEPDPEAGKRILDNAIALVPELKRATVLAHRVALLPDRPETRLERVGDVIHCYGHGAHGVELSWSHADRVVALASR